MASFGGEMIAGDVAQDLDMAFYRDNYVILTGRRRTAEPDAERISSRARTAASPGSA